jgi:hypothetical protein
MRTMSMAADAIPDHGADRAKKVSQEKTVGIEQIAQILTPRRRAGQRGLVVKTKDFAYPLDPTSLSEEEATDVRLERGDVLLSQAFHGKNKFYLVHRLPSRPCFASTFLTVIRPKARDISPEYLFFYLQSETIHRYFLQHRSGLFFPRLTLKKLRALPVILPEAETQARAERVFATEFLTRPEDLIEKANAELFAKALPHKPIQREFAEELRQRVRVMKDEVLQNLIGQDLHELEGCSRNEYYKSCVVLAGSVLEAFLLDWLSELEHKDHFASEEEFTLGRLIWKKLKAMPRDVISQEVVDRASQIKDYRNMVHPKAYIQGRQIDKALCVEVLDHLKFIIQSRKRAD